MRSFTHKAFPARIVFGAGVCHTLPDELDRLRFRRVLLIASERRAAEVGTIDSGKHIVARFTGVEAHVPADAGEQAAAIAVDLQVDALLSIGGGSSTGTAKAIARRTGLPIVAIPTTYAGSEVTAVWGERRGGCKVTGTDLRVLPRLVLYDPELTMAMPPALASASAFNALAHCVDALWAPYRDDLSELYGQQGMASLTTGLRRMAGASMDLETAAELLYGAFLAATAFGIAGTGLQHKICHILGGALGLPHAATHAIVLPHVVRLNSAYVPREIERMATAMKASDPAAALRALAMDVGIPEGLRDLGMPAASIDSITGSIVDNAPAENPCPVTTKAIRDLLANAWTGHVASGE